MAEYGIGVSMKKAFEYDRERIKMALAGKLVDGESELGFHYGEASKEECEEYILSAFDNAVYHALEANENGCILEELVCKYSGKEKPDPEIFREFMKLKEQRMSDDWQST